MNKAITLVIGGLVIIVLTVFSVLAKIDLSTFGTLTTAILGVVYGFYKKVENGELMDYVLTLTDNQNASEYAIKTLERVNQSLKSDLNKVNNRLNEVLDNVVTEAKATEVTRAKPQKASRLKK